MNAQDYTVTRNALRVFGVPAALAVGSAFGLISALLGDGVWDTLSGLRSARRSPSSPGLAPAPPD